MLWKVEADLDLIADRLAAAVTLELPATNRLLRAAAERGRLLGTALGVAGGLVALISILRQPRPSPGDDVETRRMYERAVGVSRDDARASIDRVTERLRPLAAASLDDESHQDVVCAAARILVRSIRPGQPSPVELTDTEGAFLRWIQASEGPERDSVEMAHALSGYLDSWHSLLEVRGIGADQGPTDVGG
jgi:hypothetical protein